MTTPSLPASPMRPVTLSDYERLAPAHMSEMAWEYINGGAADELTVRWNRQAFERLQLYPRNLIDVSKIDLRTTLVGTEMALPLLLAPVALNRLAHPDGELAVAKGAHAAGVTLVHSTYASTSLEEVAAGPHGPLWFQLYIQRDRGFTVELIRRAEAAGYGALVVTVDTPVIGIRNREQRTPFNPPPWIERANLKGLAQAAGSQRPDGHEIYSATLDPSATWKDIEWLRTLTRLPVLIKGILHAGDAGLAVASGVDGIIVSNHGGRNLDSVPASIDVLPRVVDQVAGRAPVLVDGGIRRGTDILKAIALGARAVLIGRPYIYGLAVGGADGVARVVHILRRELEMSMALAGRPTLASLDPSVIWKPD